MSYTAPSRVNEDFARRQTRARWLGSPLRAQRRWSKPVAIDLSEDVPKTGAVFERVHCDDPQSVGEATARGMRQSDTRTSHVAGVELDFEETISPTVGFARREQPVEAPVLCWEQIAGSR
jgi:hypothetical protein